MTIRLNDQQEIAATCLDRPVLVTAGAGSGKTRMLTQRFVNAVSPGAVNNWKPAEISEVLAITFTSKAAGEIGERVRRSLRDQGMIEQSRTVTDGWISTIHSLCSQLLRRHAFEAGVDPSFVVADTLQAGSLREAAFEAEARAQVVADSAAEALFGRYAYDDLFSAVTSTARQLAIAGMSASQLLPERAPSADDLFEQAEELFRLGGGEYEYSGSSPEPASHANACGMALRECGGIRSTFDCDDEERLRQLAEVVRAYKPISKRLKDFAELSAECNSLRDALLSAFSSVAAAPHAQALAELVAGYVERFAEAKRAAGVIDFDDLQLMAVDLLEAHPEIADQYREMFRVVMIDEFQDTDSLQLRLVEALSDGNLCTVGDEKQSIYRFRGAEIEVYRKHAEEMRNAGALRTELKVNYRSHPHLLSFVNGFFSRPDYFGDRLLQLSPPESYEADADWATRLTETPRVQAILVDQTGASSMAARKVEADEIARRIAGLVAQGTSPGDIAVLLRRYTHAHVYASALSTYNVPAVIVGGSRFFELREVATMRALLRTIANTRDSAAVAELIVSEFVPISDDAVARLRQAAPERTPLWDVMRSGGAPVSSADRVAIDTLLSVVEAAQARSGVVPLDENLLRAVEEAGWELDLLAGGNLGRDRYANILKFARQAAQFEATGAGAAGFVEYLDSKERFNDTEAPDTLANDGSDAVRLMSIHASKGLEFPVVIVPDLCRSGGGGSILARTSKTPDGILLAIRAPKDDDSDTPAEPTLFASLKQLAADAEEEEGARVLYVAFTRAEQLLIASGAGPLQKASKSKTKSDFTCLTEALGVEIPVAAPTDTLALVGGATCRVSVLGIPLPDADNGVLEADDPQPDPGGSRPSPVGAHLPSTAVAPGMPQRLSYTQLSEFAECPLRYRIRRVLRLRPIAVADGPDPLRFGSALHAVLGLADGTGAIDDRRLDSIARYQELPELEIERLRAASRRYLDSEVAKAALGHDRVLREAPFALDFDGLLLVGAIDLYARTGSEALIVDYKSGASGEAGELESRYRLQAECYALAALRDGCERVIVEFVRPEVDVESGIQAVTYQFDSDQRPAIESGLRHRFDEMAASGFEPRPSEQCRHCQVPAGMCVYRTG